MYSYLPIPRDASPEFRRAIIAENTFFALRDSCGLRPGDAQAIHGERFGNVDTGMEHGPLDRDQRWPGDRRPNRLGVSA